MPTTVNGIGTHFYGRTEPHPDGSYITTEWIALLIPILPLRSLRLRPILVKGRPTKTFEVLEKLPGIHTKQMWHVYKGLALLLLALAIGVITFVEIALVHNNIIGFFITLAIFLISGFLFETWDDRYSS